jgi:hypothetical protein
VLRIWEVISDGGSVDPQSRSIKFVGCAGGSMSSAAMFIVKGSNPSTIGPQECGYQLQRASGLFACGPAAAIAPGMTTSVPPPDTPWAWLIG